MKLNPSKKYTNKELREIGIYGVVYKVTNDINGKIYIGKTVDLRERVRGRRVEVNSSANVSKNGIIAAMRDYGLENFQYEIIDFIEIHPEFTYSDKELYERELIEKEIYWIKKLNALDEGYNQTEGGEGIYNYTTAVLQYDIEGDFIKEWSSIKAANIHLDVNSNSVSGISRVCLGLSKIAFGYQWRYKETLDFPSKIEPAPSDYWILQYDKHGNFLNEYRSPTIAAKMIDVENGGGKISECARNDYMITVYGYQWRYKEENNFPTKIRSVEEQNDLLKHYEKIAKPVIQYDLDGKFICTYRTTDEAEEKTGVFRNTIKLVAEGKYYHAGGYQWRYLNSESFPKQIKPYINPHSKAVYQYNRNTGELVNIWESAREACRKNKDWDFKQISSASNGTQKTYLDFVWSYHALDIKQAIKKGKRNTRIKPVFQYTKNKDKLIKKFSSAAEAARKLGYKSSDGITRVARGKRKHYKGYFYSYNKI